MEALFAVVMAFAFAPTGCVTLVNATPGVAVSA